MNTTDTSSHPTPTGAREDGSGESTGSGGARPPDSQPSAPAAPAVDVRNLRCAYGTFEAVRGVDMRARPGELLAVLGTNGAGKTTVLDTLRGARGPDGGTVRVLGLRPDRQRRRLAARSGVMLQDTALPDELTPDELLRLWRRLADGPHTHRPVADTLARVGLSHRAAVRIGRLSGGERRRLALGVAVSADPELLFLDEPTAGLDPESRTRAWELIRGLRRRGATIVLTTHYLEEAEALADRLVILHEGAVEVAGTLEEVLGARDARIRCRLPRGTAPPASAFVGRATVSPDHHTQRLQLRTPDLEADLRALLAWSQTNRVELRRLRASAPSLGEVFAEIRDTTTADTAAHTATRTEEPTR